MHLQLFHNYFHKSLLSDTIQIQHFFCKSWIHKVACCYWGHRLSDASIHTYINKYITLLPHFISHPVGPSGDRGHFPPRRDTTLPLLVPSGPRSTVHSSMLPNGSNIFLTSASVCCFPSMPTNSFLSSKGKQVAKGGMRGGEKQTREMCE